MDTHEISRDKPKPSGEAATPPAATSATDAGATPRMALAGIPMPAIEKPAAEPPTTGLASIEAPNITPDIDEPKPPAGEAAAEKAAGAADTPADDAGAEPPAEAAAPRVSRFTLLAATLALAAALGGMAGALAAYVLARPGPAPAATARTDVDEIQALKENVLQARVDLAALKVSIESASRSASAQLTRVGERIDRIDRTQGEPTAKLNKAIETLERLSREAAATQAKEATGSVAGVQGRPGAVAGWVVRDVQRGTALIEGRMGVIEVDQGDFVPGLGRVDAIRKQDGRWVVVTSRGIIMPAR